MEVSFKFYLYIILTSEYKISVQNIKVKEKTIYKFCHYSYIIRSREDDKIFSFNSMYNMST